MPLAHGLDDFVVTMHASVNTLLPLAVDLAGVAASVSLESLAVSHGLVAIFAMVANASTTVRLAIGDSHSTVAHEGVGGKDELDVPVSVSSLEQLLFEVTMLLHVLFLDEDATLVTHVTGGRAWVLVVVAIVLDGETLGWGLQVAADWELLRVR